MDLLDTLNISGSGLSAQRVRLRTLASNIANARTTRTDGNGGPYQRRAPVFKTDPVSSFGSSLDAELVGVKVARIETQDRVRMMFDPGHPDANEEGYVAMPDIDPLAEMVDLMTASRSYEANINVLDTTSDMASQALEIGR